MYTKLNEICIVYINGSSVEIVLLNISNSRNILNIIIFYIQVILFKMYEAFKIPLSITTSFMQFAGFSPHVTLDSLPIDGPELHFH